MKRRSGVSCKWVGILATGILFALPAIATEGPVPTRRELAHVMVTVRTHAAAAYPEMSPQDVRVYENNRSRPVVSWVAADANSRPVDLTVVIDDSVKAALSLQYRDVANFLQDLPPGTRVQVAFAHFGGNQVVQGFTSDYRQAAAALRLPVGATEAGGSIYQSIADLLSKWPQDGNRRVLLVISDGIDINQGFIESQPELNVELQRAIDLAQKALVPVYTIFARGSGALERNMFLLNNGQSCLLRLATESGGQAFFQGTITPLAFSPYLAQISNDLRHEYLLTFKPLPGVTAGYQNMRVRTEIPHVRLAAPARIFIPTAG